MPRFDGPTALTIARESHDHIPFIFTSGTIGENVAVDMKASIDDIAREIIQRWDLGLPLDEPTLHDAISGSTRAKCRRFLQNGCGPTIWFA